MSEYPQADWTTAPANSKPTNLARRTSRVVNGEDEIALINEMGIEAYHEAEQSGTLQFVKRGMQTMSELVQGYKRLRNPIVHDLLREGETMNIIAPPKYGKSWLVQDLAISVAAGIDWLGRFRTEPGKVLLLDNELHPETLAHRIPKIADARGLRPEQYANNLLVDSFRGKLIDIDGLKEYLIHANMRNDLEGVRLIILDAWYKFFPQGLDENANGDVTAMYAKLDWMSQGAPFAFVTIHHASKGNQSGKSVTDVGSGAGAQSRAPDCHLVLRQHEQDGAVTVEAACRSWKPLQPLCLRWDFPVWQIDEGLDPALLRQEKRRTKSKADEEQEWTPEMFVGTFGTAEPAAMAVIIAKAEKSKLSNRKAALLFKAAVGSGLLHEHPDANDKRVKRYANVAFVPPELPKKPGKKKPKK